jgi:catechol 2,3-dioxygenase-like lactoylglutathione lyase family enzyme
MKVAFIAGFGPIIREADAALGFWRDGLGIPLEEPADGYFTNDQLDGVKAFALWPLAQAADATFGTPEWPSDLPIPQTWLEFDVESVAAVAEAVAELRAAGHRVLRDAHEEGWGQTTSRLLSPEGILVGVTFTPWMHDHVHDDEHEHAHHAGHDHEGDDHGDHEGHEGHEHG